MSSCSHALNSCLLPLPSFSSVPIHPFISFLLFPLAINAHSYQDMEETKEYFQDIDDFPLEFEVIPSSTPKREIRMFPPSFCLYRCCASSFPPLCILSRSPRPLPAALYPHLPFKSCRLPARFVSYCELTASFSSYSEDNRRENRR